MSRRRYVQRQNDNGEWMLVEVGDEYRAAPSSTGDWHKFQYDGLRAPDGADISSRDKHKRYCKEKGLALASDFAESWRRGMKAKDDFYAGREPESVRRERRNDIAATLERMSHRR